MYKCRAKIQGLMDPCDCSTIHTFFKFKDLCVLNTISVDNSVPGQTVRQMSTPCKLKYLNKGKMRLETSR